jgi:UDP-N-acetylmuramoyl-L-alanyl-D-glutamate--2,6-diaminopimelate ligase
LDYHGDREQYFLAKRKLFSGENGCKPAQNILPVNDEYGQRLHRELGGITYGIDCEMADYNGTDLQFFPDRTTFKLRYQSKTYSCEIPLLGAFNVENALAALTAVHVCRQVPLEILLEKLKGFLKIPGRLQRVPNDRGLMILVDFAHTEDGLKNVLKSLQAVKRREIITVFGCGGNRDRSKRPKMMAAVCQGSDVIIATADNSRHEKIEAIFADMKPGILPGSDAIFEPDRTKALGLALAKAKKDDIILIAGKGHEIYQQIGDEKIPFSDAETVKILLASGHN